MHLFQNILHPTDYSAPSEFAFLMACSVARDHGARLLVLHVASTLGPEQVTMGQARTQLEPEAYRQQLWTDLCRVKPPDATVPVEHILAEGDAATEIVRVAGERGCDLIVLATHGRTGLDRLLMGSVAEHVVRKAPCPVLTIRSPITQPSA